MSPLAARSAPLKLYCEECYTGHIATSSVHMRLPADVRNCVKDAKEVERLIRKQMFVDRVLQVLSSNRTKIEGARRQVEGTFQRLAAELSQHRDTCLKALEVAESTLSNLLACIESRIHMVRYRDTPCVCELDEIVQFDWEHSPSLDRLDLISVKFAACFPPVLDVVITNPFQPAAVVPVAKNNHVFLVDVSSGEQQAVSLPAHKMDSGTAFCFHNSSSVFACGGMSSLKPSALTYELQLVPCSLRDLAPMKRARGFAGLLYHRSYMYVFGGSDGKAMRCCEKFNTASESWETMPRMLHSRCAFNPSVHRTHAILLGNHSRGAIERFKFESELFEELPQKCPVTAPVVTVMRGDELLVLTHDGVLSLHLTATDAAFTTAAPASYRDCWSNLQPVHRGSCFLFLQSNGQVPVALVCFDTERLSAQLLASF